MRFFRLAERRIAERGQRGVVCFISNSSYVREPSFVVMREHLVRNFDQIWIDNLNGDSRETGKTTPDGQPDPSVFSTPYNKEGIRKGTAIALLVKRDAGKSHGHPPYAGEEPAKGQGRVPTDSGEPDQTKGRRSRKGGEPVPGSPPATGPNVVSSLGKKDDSSAANVRYREWLGAKRENLLSASMMKRSVMHAMPLPSQKPPIGTVCGQERSVRLMPVGQQSQISLPLSATKALVRIGAKHCLHPISRCWLREFRDILTHLFHGQITKPVRTQY